MPGRVQEIFERVIERPVEDRAALLDRTCGDDAALRQEVEGLLKAHDEARGFLDAPTHAAVADSGATVAALPHEEPGAITDRYKLLQKIGEGGFGTVWLAEQREPVTRRVALKIIKLGMDTKQVIARFEAERQALAMMDHANIARVLDAGSTETGRPYFVMEYVRGVGILDYCDTERLDTRSRLGLFAQVCNAIQHAHQKGIIHRDIKPSNVMVTMHDGIPVPKVIDFGIAKATNAELTQKTLFTEHRQMIGTPAYMSPEQAEMSGLDIDTRSDIYSLGVLLYELLTGTTPFDSDSLMQAGFAEMIRIIREVEPHKPSTRLSTLGAAATRAAALRRAEPKKLGTILRGDLDWIAMKCLEKDRTRRYETANGLAADIRRHLSDEPVVAGPPSASYRLRKFVRRNRAGVMAVGVVAAALLMGIGATTWASLWALDERDSAKGAKRFMMNMRDSVDPEISRGRDRFLMFEMLEDAVARLEAGEIEDEQTAAEMHLWVGQLYFNIGALELAEPALEKAVKIRRRQLGDDHPDTLASINLLGQLKSEQGQFADAIVLHREALERRRRVLGDDHRDTIESIRDLGAALRSRGDMETAEPLYHEALERSRRVLGDDEPLTISAIHQMGFLLQKQGKPEQAEQFYRDSLERSRAVRGDDHISTIVSIIMMGSVLEELGRLSEAEGYVREALALSRHVLGADHPRTLACLNNLGSLLQNQGRLADAEPFLREAMELTDRVLGTEHPDTSVARMNLAMLLAVQGELSEAEVLCRRSLEINRRLLGEKHPLTLTAIANMGFLLHRQGKPTEAEPFLREVLQLRRDVLGDDHPETLISISNLGGFLLEHERFSEAEPLYRELLEGRRRVLGESHPRTLSSMKSLALLLERNGELSEALRLYARAVESVRAASPANPEALASELARMTMVALRFDDREWLDAALAAARECLELRVELFPDEHPQVWRRHNAVSLLGGAILARGRAAPERDAAIASLREAEPLLTGSAAWMLTDPRMPQGTRDDEAAQRVVELYDAWHALEPEAGHDERARTWRDRIDGSTGDD